MQVKLVLQSGSQAGKAMVCPPKCLIGRSDECQIRPQLDAISRKHCLITIKENEVVVRDLGSRNGTFVNDQRVKEEAVVLSGDVLRVGPVAFKVMIEETAMKPKKPVVKDVVDAAKRTLGSSSSSTQDLSDVHRWLEEEDTKEKARRIAEPETRQFRLDDTSGDSVVATQNISGDASADTKVTESADDKKDKDKDKKGTGKLPPRASTTGANSREAAADMLKKFFNRR